MCGIAVFLNKDWTRDHLQKMTDCLAHRGPDAAGIYYDEVAGLGLGHRRLSILDLSEAANQPFYSRDGRYAMIFNGEIYNYKEVAAKYNIQTQTSSDTEVIIEAFVKVGIACLNDFNGMFTIAIWDKEDKKLWLIRDRFGVKPLVYYHKGTAFAFASELKALLKLPVERKVNTGALKDYLFLEYVPSSHSMLEDFHKLPHGHYAIVKDGRVTVQPYYTFKDKIAPRPLPDLKEENVMDEFEDLLQSSIKYRQVSDVPVGAFLSGGTDSSLICAIFQQQNKMPIKTFTIGFDVAGFDESGYAKRVADILHTDHAQFRLTDKDSLSIVEKLVDYYDEPFSAPSCIPSYLVCHEARKVVTVAMSGDGGDELFMGYGYYDLYRRLKKLYRMDAGIGRKVLASVFAMAGKRYQRASRLFRLTEKDLLVQLWAEQQYSFSEKEITKLTGEAYEPSSIHDSWRKIDALKLHDYEKISLFDIEQYLSNNLLYKMDSASMANSLEVRNPYLDYRLMEFSYNLPLEYKIRNGEPKYLMKKLLEKYLPNDLVYRRKWGFPAPIGNWLYRELAYLIDKWLDPKRISAQGIFNAAEVKRYVDAFRSGKDFQYKRLWSIIIFQMWHHKYIENNAG
jgi:asparagine synthase (glutamine-hydrolysing)